MVEEHWFEPIADRLGEDYLRYSFTKGTEQEVGFLVDTFGLQAGMRLLDVGCGPGRHANALAERGLLVHGVDISSRFVDLARASASPGATFERADARVLPYEAEFDLVYSLCQGGFGLAALPGVTALAPDDPDGQILAGMARSVVPGGNVVVSAFSAYFQVRFLEEGEEFDAASGVHCADMQFADGTTSRGWTSCFTPRELRLMAVAAGLDTVAVWSVGPGQYAAAPPTIDSYEYLFVGRRPLGGSESPHG